MHYLRQLFDVCPRLSKFYAAVRNPTHCYCVTPLLIFMLYAAYRWAQGKTIAPTDENADGRIFKAMRRHALPAEPVGGFEMFRCRDCGMSFELANAQPVEDKVVLCPTCNARLFIP